jgi:hypothetical protein
MSKQKNRANKRHEERTSASASTASRVLGRNSSSTGGSAATSACSSSSDGATDAFASTLRRHLETKSAVSSIEMTGRARAAAAPGEAGDARPAAAASFPAAAASRGLHCRSSVRQRFAASATGVDTELPSCIASHSVCTPYVLRCALGTPRSASRCSADIVNFASSCTPNSSSAGATVSFAKR